MPADSEIDSVEQVAEPGVSVAIGAEGVPVGDYTREVLDAPAGRRGRRDPRQRRLQEPDVAGIVGKLTQGAVDAGFVYVSDVAAADGEICGRSNCPPSISPDVAYGIGVGSGAAEPELAQQFIDGLLDGAGRRRARRERVRPAAELSTRPRGRAAFRALGAVALGLVLVFLAVPIVSIFVEAGPGELWSALGQEAAVDALCSACRRR